MVIFAVLVLTVLAFASLALPFFRKDQRDFWSVIGSNSPEVFSERGTGNIMLKQLETDYRSGILSEEEYRSQQNAFLGTVAYATESGAGNPANLDAEIENKIARLREGQNISSGDDEIEKNVRQVRGIDVPSAAGNARKKARFCSQCGARQQSEDRFCRQCGEQLT